MKYSWVNHFLLTLFVLTGSPFLFADLNRGNEMRVYLTTSSSLESLYIGKFIKENSSLSDSYIAQLEEIFRFDVSHNSATSLVSVDPQKDQLLERMQVSRENDLLSWKNWGIVYLVKGVVCGSSLKLMLFYTDGGGSIAFQPIILTGILEEDRRLIHRAADAIYRSIYKEEGVASSQIIFSLKKKNSDRWVSEIWSSDWDGANPKQITQENSYCLTPIAIPFKDYKDRFFYVSYKLGQSKIYIASLNEGIGKRVVDLKGNQLLPALSPQKGKIAFISDVAGSPDLFVYDFFSKDRARAIQLYSFPRSSQASPTFSPDGSKIAFVSDKDGTPRIYLISSEHKGKRDTPILITKRNRENSSPAWSPDGKKLAYSAKTGETRQIWIYYFDTGREEQLTEGAGNKENPSWAPNSKHLIFNSSDKEGAELYLVNLNQPEAVKISRGAGEKSYPSWLPLRGNR